MRGGGVVGAAGLAGAAATGCGGGALCGGGAVTAGAGWTFVSATGAGGTGGVAGRTGCAGAAGMVAAGVAAGVAGFGGETTGGAGGRIIGAGGRVVCGVMKRGAGGGGVAGFAAGGGVAGAVVAAGGVAAAGFASTVVGRGAGGRGGAAGIAGAAACCFCVISFSTSPGLEMCERSILVLISSGSRPDRDVRDDELASAEARKWDRTFSASWSSSELECVFFSVTPTSVRTSRMALLLTSSSLARSLIRILLIYPFFAPPLLPKSS
jgi:hypothetical protein